MLLLPWHSSSWGHRDTEQALGRGDMAGDWDSQAGMAPLPWAGEGLGPPGWLPPALPITLCWLPCAAQGRSSHLLSGWQALSSPPGKGTGDAGSCCPVLDTRARGTSLLCQLIPPSLLPFPAIQACVGHCAVTQGEAECS